MAEADAAPAAPAEPNPGTSDAGTISEPAHSWQDALGNDPAFSDYKNADEFVKHYHNLSSMLGDNKVIRMPSNDAGAEDMDKFYARLQTVPGVVRMPTEGDQESQDAYYNKNGRPESADKYLFTEVENFEGDKQIDADYAAMAHGLGLTNKQADGVRQHLANNVVAQNVDAKADADAAMDVLRKNWGQGFDQKILEAQDTVLHVERSQMIPNLSERLKETGLEHNPLMMELMDVLRQYMTEEQVEDSGVYSGVVTPADAEARIQEIRNARRADPGHILNHEEHPGYEAERKRFDQLYNIARG